MAWSRTPQDISFSTFDLNWGFLAIRPIDVRSDVTLLHGWLIDPRTTPRSPGRVSRVRRLLEAMLVEPERRLYLGFRDDIPAFLFETFRPEHDPQAPRPGAVGVRMLSAPGEEDTPGFSTAILRTIVKLVLDDPVHDRVVLESEVAEARLTRLAAGFRTEQRITAHGREIFVSTCSRADVRAEFGLEAAG